MTKKVLSTLSNGSLIVAYVRAYAELVKAMNSSRRNCNGLAHEVYQIEDEMFKRGMVSRENLEELRA